MVLSPNAWSICIIAIQCEYKKTGDITVPYNMEFSFDEQKTTIKLGQITRSVHTALK